jgi:hypothetical protein
MSQYVRFSLTGVLYFPYSSKESLSKDASKFKVALEKRLFSSPCVFLPSEFSVSLKKANDLGFVPRTNDEERSTLSYHLSIMAHADAYSYDEIDGLVHKVLKEALTKSLAGLVIFSSVSEEKDSRKARLRLGSQYNFNKRTGLVYSSVRDFDNNF